jgi:hypothetical protein
MQAVRVGHRLDQVHVLGSQQQLAALAQLLQGGQEAFLQHAESAIAQRGFEFHCCPSSRARDAAPQKRELR